MIVRLLSTVVQKRFQSFKVCQSVVFKVPFTQVGIIVLKFQTCKDTGWKCACADKRKSLALAPTK